MVFLNHFATFSDTRLGSAISLEPHSWTHSQSFLTFPPLYPHSPCLNIPFSFAFYFYGSFGFLHLALFFANSLANRALVSFLGYVGFVAPSKRGYNAKKRSEAALITAQNGMFIFDYRYAFFTVYTISCCGILEVCGAMWQRLAAFLSKDLIYHFVLWGALAC